MNKYFEVTAKVKGDEKTVSIQYVLDTMNWGSSEQRISKELEGYNFEIKRINPSQISEIIGDLDAELFFKGKISFITIDEEKAVEKRVNGSVLIGAENIDKAKELLTESLSGYVGGAEIKSISETKITQFIR